MAISPIDLSIVAVYIAGMLGIGYYIFKKAPNFEEYLVAGRSMTTPILVCTLASTYYGLDVLFGTSEVGFNDGVVAFFGYSEMSLGFYLFAAYGLSRKLKEANFTSLPEILTRQYGQSAGYLGAISSIIYSIPALSLFALGRISEVMFGIDAQIGALLLGSIALIYTLWGGLWAVAITDTVQFVFMCVTLAIAVPLLMSDLGGFDTVAAHVPSTHFDIFGGIPFWLMLAYMATGISILVDPAFYQRIFAAKNFSQVRNAMLIALVVWGAYDWLVTAAGMLARSGVAMGALPADLHSNDALLTAVVMALPVGLVGLFLAGVLATAMSTIDSYSLVAGANISYDVYRPLFKPDATDRELVRATKIGIAVSWILGYLLAFLFERLMSLWVFNASLMTSTVLVPIFMGLFWKGRKTAAAGILSFLFGLVSVAVFYFGISQLGAYNETWGTYIWTFEFSGSSYELWQEYSLFFSLPISFLGFLIGNLFGSPRATHLGEQSQ
ncbi:MAG: sodium:solute symporter family protein [Myxococcota bacterium]|jgi:Na+/proline symporter|nr:sodium:solute symporter family protein [Myxococcota bacterium]